MREQRTLVFDDGIAVGHPRTFEELAHSSDAIVVGKIASSSTGRTISDQRLVAASKVAVEEVFKGDLVSPCTVTLLRPLRWAAGQEPGPDQPMRDGLALMPGQRYLLFLREDPDDLGYRLLAGPDSVFWLRRDGAAAPVGPAVESRLGRLRSTHEELRLRVRRALGPASLVQNPRTGPASAVVGDEPEDRDDPAAGPTEGRAGFAGQPVPLPGVVQAENFDWGSNGVAYRDLTSGDQGKSRYRAGDADIKRLADGGHALVLTSPGEWFEYSVSAARSRTHLLEVRVASSGCGGRFHIEIDGRDVTGPLWIPNTESWIRDWTVVRRGGIPIASGVHVLRLVIDDHGSSGRASAGSIDFIRLAPFVSKLPQPASASKSISEAQVEIVHPRLWVTTARLGQIRSAVKQKGSHHGMAWDAVWLKHEAVQDRASQARTAALSYLIEGRREDAQRAFDALVHDGAAALVPTGTTARAARNLASDALAHALVYDWCYRGLSEAQRTALRNAIQTALNNWSCLGFDELLETPFTTPAVAQLRGAELIMMLALGEEKIRAPRYARLKGWLAQHIANTYEETGLAPTGVAASYEAGLFLFPAVYAMRGVGDRDLEVPLASRAWWRLMERVSTSGGPVPLGGGVEGSHRLFRSGWASLVLESVPSAHRMAYLCFYDRHVGRMSADRSFDSENGGGAWTLLYYPTGEAAADCTESTTAVAYVERTRVGFRGGRPEDEVLVAVSADAPSRDDREWNELPTAFDFELTAFGRRFTAGPLVAEHHGFSTLLVDGRAYRRRTDDGGDILAVEPRPDGGYAVVDGGEKYGNLGISSARRHVFADFSGRGGPAVVSTLDRLRAPGPHTYTWQMSLPQELKLRRSSFRASAEAGIPSFLVRAEHGTLLKGWVLSPPDARVITDNPLQIWTQASDADLWVVMAVAKDTEPMAERIGDGLEAQLRIGDLLVRYDSRSDRIVAAPYEPIRSSSLQPRHAGGSLKSTLATLRGATDSARSRRDRGLGCSFNLWHDRPKRSQGLVAPGRRDG